MARFRETYPVGNGRFENINPVPTALPTGAHLPRSLEQIVSDMLNMRLNAVTDSNDIEPETFEEMQDFGDEDEDTEQERILYGQADDIFNEKAKYWAELNSVAKETQLQEDSGQQPKSEDVNSVTPPANDNAGGKGGGDEQT